MQRAFLDRAPLRAVIALITAVAYASVPTIMVTKHSGEPLLLVACAVGVPCSVLTAFIAYALPEILAEWRTERAPAQT